MLYYRKDEQHKCFSLSLENTMFSWQRRLKSGVMNHIYCWKLFKDHRQPESLIHQMQLITVSMSPYTKHSITCQFSNTSSINSGLLLWGLCCFHMPPSWMLLGINVFNLAGSPELLQRGVHWPGHLWLLGGHTAGALQWLLVVQSVKDERGRMCQRHTGSWMFTQSIWLVYTPTVTEMNKRWIQ